MLNAKCQMPKMQNAENVEWPNGNLPTANRQPPTANRQPPTANREDGMDRIRYNERFIFYSKTVFVEKAT
jgi:hypothetical protein